MDEARAGAEALIRATVSLSDAALRAAYLASVARNSPLADVARVFDMLCERAEQAEAAAREVLVALVDALNGAGMVPVVQRLREQCAGESLLALERLLRHPPRAASSRFPPAREAPRPVAARAGATGQARELTLGERKSLARRPDRDLMQRLLGDSHPEVVARCLRNPRVVEDDVVRLAAKRPGRGEVLAQVARSPWARRPRVRMALVLNPNTPLELAVKMTGLLLRPELEQVARSPGADPAVRAVCLEHLQRRPPVRIAVATSPGVH